MMHEDSPRDSKSKKELIQKNTSLDEEYKLKKKKLKDIMDYDSKFGPDTEIVFELKGIVLRLEGEDDFSLKAELRKMSTKLRFEDNLREMSVQFSVEDLFIREASLNDQT